MSIFVYEYSFTKVGYILGVSTTVFICYMSAYGSYIVAKISYDLEKAKNIPILTFHGNFFS